jgi:sulfur carrier protein
MIIHLNGKAVDVTTSMLSEALKELGYEGAVVATAVNKTFIPVAKRAVTPIRDGDAIEIISPRQGG